LVTPELNKAKASFKLEEAVLKESTSLLLKQRCGNFRSKKVSGVDVFLIFGRIFSLLLCSFPILKAIAKNGKVYHYLIVTVEVPKAIILFAILACPNTAPRFYRTLAAMHQPFLRS
jgi:hypothetical protein